MTIKGFGNRYATKLKQQIEGDSPTGPFAAYDRLEAVASRAKYRMKHLSWAREAVEEGRVMEFLTYRSEILENIGRKIYLLQKARSFLADHDDVPFPIFGDGEPPRKKARRQQRMKRADGCDSERGAVPSLARPYAEDDQYSIINLFDIRAVYEQSPPFGSDREEETESDLPEGEREHSPTWADFTSIEVSSGPPSRASDAEADS